MGSDPGEALKEISPGWPKATAQALDHATERWWWWFSHQVMADSCEPMDCSLPGSSVHGILQARILEWVAISFSRGSSWPGDWTCISRIDRLILYCCASREAQLLQNMKFWDSVEKDDRNITSNALPLDHSFLKGTEKDSSCSPFHLWFMAVYCQRILVLRLIMALVNIIYPCQKFHTHFLQSSQIF